jgi:hypothetical protein
MRRRKKRGPRRVKDSPNCLAAMGLYPPGRPCFYGDYHNFDYNGLR